MATSNIPRYIDAESVRSVLTWPLINEAVEEAMKAICHTQPDPVDPDIAFACQPTRSLTTAPNRGQILFTMPAYVSNYQLSLPQSVGRDVDHKLIHQSVAAINYSTLACKLVTCFGGNQQQVPALPNILANILLFSAQTGQLECIMDGTQITAWRTAAASIVATKYLYYRGVAASTRSSINVAIIGCGVQGQSHALGMCATFPVSSISLWNRTSSKAEALADQLRRSDVSAKTAVSVARTPTEAVRDADVICVGTFSEDALVGLEMLQKSAVHINTVGAGRVHFGEVAQNIYEKARVYVDSWASAKVELKDLKAEIVDEVGQVICSKKYPQAGGITIFQSMGMAAEDATVAQAVYETLK